VLVMSMRLFEGLRAIFWMVAMLLPLACRVEAQTSDSRLEFDVRVNELRMDGTITEVNPAQQALILDVKSVAHFGGSTSGPPTPPSQKVLITSLTSLYVRGSGQRVSLADLSNLRERPSAVVIGVYSPGRGNVLAREIAIWNKVEAGKFRLEGVPERPLLMPALPLLSVRFGCLAVY
jgi:hypothetical protein